MSLPAITTCSGSMYMLRECLIWVIQRSVTIAEHSSANRSKQVTTDSTHLMHIVSLIYRCVPSEKSVMKQPLLSRDYSMYTPTRAMECLQYSIPEQQVVCSIFQC